MRDYLRGCSVVHMLDVRRPLLRSLGRLWMFDGLRRSLRRPNLPAGRRVLLWRLLFRMVPAMKCERCDKSFAMPPGDPAAVVELYSGRVVAPIMQKVICPKCRKAFEAFMVALDSSCIAPPAATPVAAPDPASIDTCLCGSPDPFGNPKWCFRCRRNITPPAAPPAAADEIHGAYPPPLDIPKRPV